MSSPTPAGAAPRDEAAVSEMRKALHCLRLEVAPDIVHDLTVRFERVLRELAAVPRADQPSVHRLPEGIELRTTPFLPVGALYCNPRTLLPPEPIDPSALPDLLLGAAARAPGANT